MNTIQTRKDIGFPKQKTDWNKTRAVFDDHTLRIAGHPVMEDWEKEYMNTLAAVAARSGGSVLELGFGMGLSAEAIQRYPIDTHYVIECHPDVVTRGLDQFHDQVAAGRMHFLTGFWQEVSPMLKDGSFNGILFDTYPLSEEEIHSNHFWFFEEAYRLLRPGGTLTYYSDEAKGFSKRHLRKLLDAGFKEANISSKICTVDPPVDCEYWQAKTLLVPIVTK